MNADRVDIFNEAHCDDIVFGVADYLELKLLPTADTLLNEHLSYERSLQASFANYLELVNIVHHAAACSAHCIGRAKNHWVFELLCDLYSLVNGISLFTAGHSDTESAHCVLEFYSVLTALDSVYLHTDDLYAVLFKNSRLVELRTKIKTGLSAEIREKCIGTFLVYYLSESCNVERLYVRDIGNIWVCHDSCGIRVHENYLITELFQCLARLSSRIVELASLTDYDRSRAYYHYLIDILSFWHIFLPTRTFVR